MLIKDAKFRIIDIETTGLCPDTDQIIEMAIVECNLAGIVSATSSLFNPGRPIPPAAQAIHHIIDEDVADCDPFDRQGHFVESPFFTYAAHNAQFEDSFLKFTNATLCTMRLAQKLWPELDGYSNQQLRYELKLNPPIKRSDPVHRALPDALVTATLLIHELSVALPMSKDPDSATVEDLIAWVDRPMLLTTVKFGKHGPQNGKPGLKWNEVPKDYLRWIVNTGKDFDRDVMFTAKHYLAK